MKRNKRRLKRPITLIEVLIVILLIGMIGGALAFNMRGSLNEGRVFATEQTILRVKDILEYELARGTASSEVQSKWQGYVENSPMGNKKLLEDGWKKQLSVSVTDEGVVVISNDLENHKKKQEALKKPKS